MKYGFKPDMIPEDAQGIPARVTAVHRERYEVVCEYGETGGRLKSSEYYGGSEVFPTTGDFVMIDYNPGGDSRIIKTLERRTLFSRRDPTPGRGEQAVASNFDYVFIMQSLNHDFNTRRMERYLALALQSGAEPVIVLTKSDLTDNCGEYIGIAESLMPGIAVYTLSSETGDGLEALDPYLAPGKTIVFLGSSGVGKSSLVNALAGEEIMAVNDIREDDSKGCHTTTHRQLIMLKNGSMIIDTPGMRELGMWDASEGLGGIFADVEKYLGRCRFSDCKHQTEPGCAIRAAIENGELSVERWESYTRLRSDEAFSDDKAEYLRKKEEKFMKIAMYNKQNRQNAKRYGRK